MRSLVSITLLITMLGLVAAPAVMAQSPTVSGYDESDVLGSLDNETSASPSLKPPAALPDSPSSSGTPAESEPGSLPFTGVDVVILALMGLALVATGLSLRRRAGSAS
jgi:hypothetical protein